MGAFLFPSLRICYHKSKHTAIKLEPCIVSLFMQPDQLAFAFQAPTGPQLKEAGTALVRANSGLWKDKAAAVIEQLAARKSEFTSDDLRDFATKCGLEDPHHVNAWGAAMSAAAKRNVIQATGRFIRSNRPDAHSRMVGVWRSCLKG